MIGMKERNLGLERARPAKHMQASLDWSYKTIQDLSKMGYTGKIEFNFNQGGITNINLSQSIKPLQEIRIIPIGTVIQVV